MDTQKVQRRLWWWLVVFILIYLAFLVVRASDPGCPPGGELCVASWQETVAVFPGVIGFGGTLLFLALALMVFRGHRIGREPKIIIGTFFAVWTIAVALVIISQVTQDGWSYYWGSLTGRYNPARLYWGPYIDQAYFAAGAVFVAWCITLIMGKRAIKTDLTTTQPADRMNPGKQV